LVFGVIHLPNSLWYALPHTLRFPPHDNDNSDSVLSSPQILNVPLLLLANKQDSPGNLSATEIRHDYEEWDQRRRESAWRRFGEDEDAEMERKLQRIGSLDVMDVSALDGLVSICLGCGVRNRWSLFSTGVREGVDWLFLRAQNSRQCVN